MPLDWQEMRGRKVAPGGTGYYGPGGIIPSKTTHWDSSRSRLVSVITTMATSRNVAKGFYQPSVPVVALELFVGHISVALVMTQDEDSVQVALAGPRVVEHLVDVVLMFEGDRQQLFRVLRSIKNRFGSTSELGLFAMEGEGLVGIEDPSRLLLEERPVDRPGSVVVAAFEGTRPLMVEVQALLVRSFGAPRRVVSGMDPHRVALVLAVIERHLGIRISEMDAYFKVTGGISLDDPGMDLGVLAAALSSFSGKAIPPQWAVSGEVGLTGEIRRVSRLNDRIKEAAALGFTRVLVPGTVSSVQPGVLTVAATRVHEVVSRLGLESEEE